MSEVPLYTREQRLALTATATDAVAEVKHVWCSFNNGKAIAATEQQDGTWKCEGELTVNSANVVAVWAEDSVGNSGASGKPPYMQVVTVVQAENGLAVVLNASAPATYYDENKMTVTAAMPPVYERNGVGMEVITPGATIHKAATRLASRILATTAADLEGANPDNLPWLQFGVALTGAPVAAATYAIEATAGGAPVKYSDDLIAWRSPQSSASATSGSTYFDLPLDAVRIPILTTASGPVALKVTVAVMDAAGNQGGDQVGLTYQVIGPPLQIIVDSDYAKAGASNSAFPYTIAGGTYGTLFNAADNATFGATQQVRLARLVVTNPAPQPVALDVSGIGGGSWSMTETWSGNQSGTTGSYVFNSTCPGDNGWAKAHATMYAPLGGTLGAQDPGASSVGWGGVAASSTLSSVAEFRDSSTLAPVGGRYIVPAASGSAPGVVNLYVVRPLGASRAGAPTLGAAPYRNDQGTLYAYASEGNSSCCAQGWLPTVFYACISSANAPRCALNQCEWYTSAWHATATHTYCEPGTIACPVANRDYSHRAWWLMANNNGQGTPCTNCTGTCACSSWVLAQTYNTYTYYQQLASASDAVSVSFVPGTQATDDKGNVYGVANVGAASITITNSYTH